MGSEVRKSVEKVLTSAQRIAVIGAGPCGAVVTKALLAENCFSHIQVFEQRATFGGLWNFNTHQNTDHVPSIDPWYTPSPTIATGADIASSNLDEEAYKGVNPEKDGAEYAWLSAIYELLDTNVPSPLMEYHDLPFGPELPLFPSHLDVLKYMQAFARGIESHVKFGTKVVSVEQDNSLKWNVVHRAVSLGTHGGADASDDVTETFDVVVMATGNYDTPYIPVITGLAEWNERYPGSITHSKAFKHPRDFTAVKKEGEIVVVGNSASGADIAFQLATYFEQTIYQSVRSENSQPAGANPHIVKIGEIGSVDKSLKIVLLKNGETLTNVAAIVFATGYLKSFKMLEALNRESENKLITDGARVHGLYDHMLSLHHPGLVFIGLPRFVLPTHIAESQGSWLTGVLAGRIALPEESVLTSWEGERVLSHGNGRYFHDMQFPEDVAYYLKLNRQVYESGGCGYVPGEWSEERVRIRASTKAIKEAYIKMEEITGRKASSVADLVEAGYFKWPES
ncbi:hypothetical protein BABINDRAFT_158856 [Babjeviella inositovora NRRL Y-12698]|uniref:FAD/NAD(P)-binding domain-containing protein n=1 Tax=Babjeviella inositovora NRRL Y-12698 TaxID=984486 RepID=A0A1E3QX86_9ASCO|nr:uncharacterized protein BABINDRAFT_158856 [Babjeviella inositovora NRRL Y-12698]ODQ82211.1 hypothetical protein BABINDRAFT_158856 [Babjeviella inositovora NRRL Y-12698]